VSPEQRPRVVLDPVVYVLALPPYFLESAVTDVLSGVSHEALELVTSPQILAEIQGILLNAIGASLEESTAVICRLARLATLYVSPEESIALIDTPAVANRLLEAAQEAAADYIITLEPSLLKLDKWHGIKMVKPKDFEFWREEPWTVAEEEC